MGYPFVYRGKKENGPASPAGGQGGQALVLVVLVMTVTLVVALSTALRSITNFRISNELTNSERALSAAEAGVEQVISTGLPITNQTLGNATIKQVVIAQTLGSEFLLSNGTPVVKDQGELLWFVPHITDTLPDYSTPWSGTVSIYWGSSTDICNSDPSVNTMAAIEAIIISGSRSAPLSNRYVFDPCFGRRSSNSFNPVGAGGTVAGKAFSNSASIAVSNGLVGRVVPIYANAVVGVAKSVGSPDFPSQGKRIESTATAGTTTRKVVFYKTFQTLPTEFFSYVLFWPKAR